MTVYELANRLDSSPSFIDTFAGRPEFQKFIVRRVAHNSRIIDVCPEFIDHLKKFLQMRIDGRGTKRCRDKYQEMLDTNLKCLY